VTHLRWVPPRSRGTAAYTLSTPRASHSAPPYIWASLSSLGKSEFFSNLLKGFDDIASAARTDQASVVQRAQLSPPPRSPAFLRDSVAPVLGDVAKYDKANISPRPVILGVRHGISSDHAHRAASQISLWLRDKARSRTAQPVESATAAGTESSPDGRRDRRSR
jgi:hypothetical protein